jgi:hypothetical protein
VGFANKAAQVCSMVRGYLRMIVRVRERVFLHAPCRAFFSVDMDLMKCCLSFTWGLLLQHLSVTPSHVREELQARGAVVKMLRAETLNTGDIWRSFYFLH